MAWPLSSLVQVFDFGGQWGKATIRPVDGDDASVMVKKTENIIEDAVKILKSHERLLPAKQYKIFTTKHRRLQLRVLEIKHSVDDENRQSLLSASSVDRQAHRTDVIQLYDNARSYYTDVVSASRRAQAEEDELYEVDYNAPQSSSSNSQVSGTTTCYSVTSNSTETSRQSENTSTTGSETSAPADGYLAVVHNRENAEGDRSEDDAYHASIVLAGGNNAVIVMNPKAYTKEGLLSLDANTILEMFRAAVVGATNPESLEEYHSIDMGEEPSWVESMIQSMARLGAGVGSQMV